MGKHLTIEEKLNAENELKENRLVMKWLRQRINEIKYRNSKLENYLVNKKNSKHEGLYGIDGSCYKLFGKKFRDLTVEQRREYHRITKINRDNKAKSGGGDEK